MNDVELSTLSNCTVEGSSWEAVLTCVPPGICRRAEEFVPLHMGGIDASDGPREPHAGKFVLHPANLMSSALG